MTAIRKSRLAHNFFSLGTVQVINSSLQLLVIPHVIKVIGADGFGIIAVAQVVMFFLSTFVDYGFSQTATRQVSIYRNDPDKLSAIFFRVMFSKLFLGTIALGLLVLLVLIVPTFRAHSFLYLIGFAMVFGQSMLLNWFFQGLEKMWFIAITTLFGRLVFVLLVFLFITHKTDGSLFLFFVGTGNIVAGITGYIIARRIIKLHFTRPSGNDIGRELKEGWPFTITNLSMNTCQYANIFILGFFTSNLVVGYFSIAERIFFTLKQVLSVFAQAIYPRVCLLVQHTKDELMAFYKKVFLPFLFCVIGGSLLLSLLAQPVIHFFSGDEAVHSVFFLRMMCIVLVIVCLNIPSTLSLLAMNKKKSYFTVYTLGGILNIVANIIFASNFQSEGTIIAIFITEIFITAGVIYESRRPALPVSPGTI
jgi:PST family polysaccharide transporter